MYVCVNIFFLKVDSVIDSVLRLMQSKREMLICKNLKDAEVVSKLEISQPFVLRKGRSVMANMCKDKDTKLVFDTALAEFRKRLSETSKPRYQFFGRNCSSL